MKKHKMLVEFVAHKETELGAIGLLESVKFMQAIGNTAKKHGFSAYAKGYPKENIDYIPSGKQIELKTLEDIAKLSAEQFEMLIEDLRSWCNLQKSIQPMIDLGIVKHEPGMTWIDDGNSEATVNIEITNKI